MLPHIQNSEAGRNLYDPVHKNIFEVYFTLPEPLVAEFGQDTAVLTEHVLKIDGLGTLYKAPDTGTQKFMGTDRTFINPRIDGTSAEIGVDLSLNLRNGTDNYILKLFRAWAKLGMDIATGERSLKKDYCADWLKVSVANRVGDIYQEIVFKDVMMAGPIEGLEDLDYESNDAVQIKVKFKSDWWKETML